MYRIACILVLFIACQTDNVQLEEDPYFSITEFLNEHPLPESEVSISMAHQGIEEKRQEENYDFEKEKNVLKSFELNTRALEGKYRIEKNEQNNTVSYLALNDELPVNVVTVYYNENGQVKKITGQRSVESFITNAYMDVIYSINEDLITIRERQIELFGKPDTFLYQVNW